MFDAFKHDMGDLHTSVSLVSRVYTCIQDYNAPVNVYPRGGDGDILGIRSTKNTSPRNKTGWDLRYIRGKF